MGQPAVPPQERLKKFTFRRGDTIPSAEGGACHGGKRKRTTLLKRITQQKTKNANTIIRTELRNRYHNVVHIHYNKMIGSAEKLVLIYKPVKRAYFLV